jgi:thioredoxin-like negative regulator of GroEL
MRSPSSTQKYLWFVQKKKKKKMASSYRFDVVEEVLEEAALNDLLSNLEKDNQGPAIVLVSSDWCPDCKKSDPRISETLKKRGDAGQAFAFVHLNVGDRKTWRTIDHVYREHSVLEVDRIPTLYHLRDGKVAAKLVEDQCYNPPARLDEFLDSVFEN